MTFLGLVGGEAGGEEFEFIECKEETECFALLWRVTFPGSLKDINFLMAWGLSVPKIVWGKNI